MQTFYVTTPIYYPSDKLHIGHSYCTVATDAIARYKRMLGYDVRFVTGADEHGQKIERIAAAAGVTPQHYVDKVVAGIVELWKLMDISNDDFIRTTQERHIKTVQKIFKRLYDQGDIYKGSYEGWYCTPCEAFFTERQLVDGKCPDCGRPVEKMKEEAYFMRLSKYAPALMDYIAAHPGFIQPESRKNEMINNFLKPGLEDLCVSRTSFKWGVPVDFDPGHIVYVWVDALSNYISALGYLSDDESLFLKYWPADLHVVGKEIIRFHTIIWPIMLMALGLPLPKQVFGHGWLILEGGKMSKSKGNVVDPVALVNRYGVDAIRYFLLRDVQFGQDGTFSNEALVHRINSDLANDLGNLVSRTGAMIGKYFDGYLTSDAPADEWSAEIGRMGNELASLVDGKMDGLKLNEALADIWTYIGRLNKYIDQTAPWLLARDESKRPALAGVLYRLAEGLRICAILLTPFLTRTGPEILDTLGVSAEFRTYESAKAFGSNREVRVKKREALFPRIDVEKELAALEKLTKKEKKAEKKKKEEEAPPSEVTYDEFARIVFKTAKVIECEAVEGSDKLLKLQLDVGGERRQIVSGIRDYYTPESMVGKTIIVVANLKSAKIRGVESNGMLLAVDEGGALSLLTTDKDVSSGLRVR